MHYFYCCALC